MFYANHGFHGGTMVFTEELNLRRVWSVGSGAGSSKPTETQLTGTLKGIIIPRHLGVDFQFLSVKESSTGKAVFQILRVGNRLRLTIMQYAGVSVPFPMQHPLRGGGFSFLWPTHAQQAPGKMEGELLLCHTYKRHLTFCAISFPLNRGMDSTVVPWWLLQKELRLHCLPLHQSQTLAQYPVFCLLAISSKSKYSLRMVSQKPILKGRHFD